MYFSLSIWFNNCILTLWVVVRCNRQKFVAIATVVREMYMYIYIYIYWEKCLKCCSNLTRCYNFELSRNEFLQNLKLNVF